MDAPTRMSRFVLRLLEVPSGTGTWMLWFPTCLSTPVIYTTSGIALVSLSSFLCVNHLFLRGMVFSMWFHTRS